MIFNKLVEALKGNTMEAAQRERVRPRRIITIEDNPDDDKYMSGAREKLTQNDMSGPEVVGAMPSEKRNATENLMLRGRKRIMRGLK